MFDFLLHVFDTRDFPRRWDCGTWSDAHGWLHIASDVATWGAYMAIPLVLGFFLVKRRDLPFLGVFWLFAAFILACGAVHLVEAAIFWWPAYRVSGLLKLITAVVSWSTVFASSRAVPKATTPCWHRPNEE